MEYQLKLLAADKSNCSSLRTSLQVWSTICCMTALLPCSLLLVDRMSECKRQLGFICATHLWISTGGLDLHQ
ncbi:hypothetical protein L208DRAFT_766667 [Tricholoma matsutake]|nr:hypothetical protein L208DRAFT_766667 [Tricholoma matsutake 945]